jgi:thiamine-monophosphate kinase
VSTTTVGDLGEHALIARITNRLPRPARVVVGPGDDAAVLEPVRNALDVLTTDALVDGVHFDTRFVPARAIGHRALAVNLSDLAAMGARPRNALLSLALPTALSADALDGFIDGFLACAGDAQVAVVGGNITRTPGPWVISVTAQGSVHRRGVLTRSGARPGDGLYVTGWLGAAATGLASLRARADSGETETSASPVQESEQRYLYPVARLRAGLQLSHHRAASSCIDLSDGLADGVRQLALASGVGIRVDADALPILDEVRRWHDAHGSDAVAAALTGGDDYELAFTVRTRHAGRLRGAARRCGDLPITRIGEVTKDTAQVVRCGSSVTALPEGFEHFR